jgi:hypothetical protein
MKAAQMAECLQRIAPLLEPGEAAKLRQLSDVVAAEGDKSFGPYCVKVAKGLAAQSLSPSASAAAEMMIRIGEIAHAAGASPQAKDFLAAGGLLETLGGFSATELPGAIAKALEPPPKKPARPPKPAVMEPRVAADLINSLRYRKMVPASMRCSMIWQNFRRSSCRMWLRPTSASVEPTRANRRSRKRSAPVGCRTQLMRAVRPGAPRLRSDRKRCAENDTLRREIRR